MGTAAIAIPLALVLWREHQAALAAEPPRPRCTLSELAKKVAKPERLAVISHSGAERLIWIGRVPRFSLASGPPCYIFDKSGLLIDWCSNTGEGWWADSLLGEARAAPGISLDEAARWCRRQTR
jgi:hypothetical protein